MLVLIPVFLFGAILGSLANVFVVRLKDATTLWGRSHCPECKTTLPPHHLVPILSWVFLRGRCVFCKRRIHIQYPLVEIASGILAVLVVLHTPLLDARSAWLDLLNFFILWWLLVCVVFDVRWKLLPVEFMVFGMVVLGAGRLVLGMDLSSVVIGGVIGAAFFAIQYLVSRGQWIGMGDLWLGGLIGIVLGWPGIGIALMGAYIFGAIVALVLLLAGKVTRKTRLPMAPFLAFGAFVTMFFGREILSFLFDRSPLFG